MGIGRKLREFRVSGVQKVDRKGRNRVGILFNSWMEANSFLNHRLLKERNLEAYLPSSLVTCKGVARNVLNDVTGEDIMSEIRPGPKILDVKRIKKRQSNDKGEVKYIETETVILIFEGKIIPKFVTIDYCDVPVHVYVNLVLLCFNCLRFGHSAKQCRSA